MANIVKIKTDGRIWNCYLEKFEDECTEEEVRIADAIISIDESLITAHENNDVDRINDLQARKMALMAMIDVERE